MLAWWRTTIPVALLALVACNSAIESKHAGSPPHEQSSKVVVAYRLSPVFDAGTEIEALKVDVVLTGQVSGSNEVRLPARFAGGPDLTRTFTDVTASGGELFKGEHPGQWIVRALAGAKITFSYLVHSGIDHDPDSADEQPFAP
ncbi:MAG: hypothetical protein GC155_14150 [Alphaproteobacteria bacterium]|nr:hypothetical protein [Alphaproteobacteria bacterium]